MNRLMNSFYYGLLLALLQSLCAFPAHTAAAAMPALLLPTNLIHQADSLDLAALQAAFSPLVDKTWRAEGRWQDGTAFRQEVHFSWGLEQQAVVAQTHGFVDAKQEEWGQRNQGIRYLDRESGELHFSEFDVFGGNTSGTLELNGKNIYYHYNYEGTMLTDAWEAVDEHTYNFTVGTKNAAGSWEHTFLETQFIAQMNEDLAMPTDLSLPYREIPDAPNEYNACTVAARMIDGLGFRYYWATEGLRQVDLDYRTTAESRTSGETIDHIYGLARVVHNAVMGAPNIRGAEAEELTYAEKRARTLQMLKAASDQLRNSPPGEMNNFKIIFQRGEQSSEFPFWNNLNGPLADAIWHVGQVVAFRRASGNPFNSNVSVFSGTVRE